MQEIEWTEASGPDWVEVQVGVVAPARFRLSRGLPKVEGGAVVGVESPTLVAEFITEPGGRVVLDGLTVQAREGRPFPKTYVKASPLESKAREALPGLLRSDPREALPTPDERMATLKARRVRRLAAQDDIVKPKRRRGPTPADLKEAARIHRESTSNAPASDVAATFNISEPTVSRWLKLAQEGGEEIGERGKRVGKETAAVKHQAVLDAVAHAESTGRPVVEVVRQREPRNAQGEQISTSTAWRRIRKAKEWKKGGKR